MATELGKPSRSWSLPKSMNTSKPLNKWWQPWNKRLDSKRQYSRRKQPRWAKTKSNTIALLCNKAALWGLKATLFTPDKNARIWTKWNRLQATLPLCQGEVSNLLTKRLS
jgi:hypothetical protein